MKIPEKCKELFLEGITDAYIYPVLGTHIPLPFSVPQIVGIKNCQFAEALLHISTDDSGNAIADSITSKSTSQKAGKGLMYTIETSITVTDGKENVREAVRKMVVTGENYYVVLKREDDQLYLCYTLPGTFAFSTSTSSTQTSEQVTLTVSMKSMSDFIPITTLS